MKTRMGKNVDFVRLLAKASRKVVAAATGVVKDWYSSVWRNDKGSKKENMQEIYLQKLEHNRQDRCPKEHGGIR